MHNRRKTKASFTCGTQEACVQHVYSKKEWHVCKYIPAAHVHVLNATCVQTTYIVRTCSTHSSLVTRTHPALVPHMWPNINVLHASNMYTKQQPYMSTTRVHVCKWYAQHMCCTLHIFVRVNRVLNHRSTLSQLLLGDDHYSRTNQKTNLIFVLSIVK